MSEEGSVNAVSKTDSNGNSMPEKILGDRSEKKDLEVERGKIVENNGVKDLNEDGVKEMEVDKKVDDEEGVEVEEVKKVDDGEVVKDNKKVDSVIEIQEDKKDDGMQEKEEDKKNDFLNETEEKKKDDDNGFDNDKLDEETGAKEAVDGKEEKENVEAKKRELDVMEEEGITKDKDEISEKEKIHEDEVDDKSKEEDQTEDNEVEKGLKKRGKGKIDGEKVKKRRKELKETEPRTPAINRPVRERKTVERLVTSIEKDASKEFQIEKGRGTPLKDIPNVAFKLSRRKVDDTCKLLHTILFGRRGKAVQIKNNISRFSGFVWHENEEKQMNKVKEKFDKCNKEKLLEFCDVLDIQLSKATTKKEDVVAKLIDFLVAPQVTTTVLLAENEKSSKGKKRKRVAKQGPSRSGTTTSRHTSKSRKKNKDSSVAEERKSATDTENESEEEEKDKENKEENENVVPDKSEDEMTEQSESEDKNDSDDESEDVKKPRKANKTSSTKKESAAKSRTNKTTAEKKSRSAPKRISKKSLPTHSDSDEDSEGSPKVSSRKKNIEKRGKQKTSTLTTSSKKKTEKVTKGKGKNKDKVKPSDDQLREAICEIFKEVDFNTATFTDILKLLAKQFSVDLTPRKASIKVIIQEELTKLADEADEDEEGDAENDETLSAGQEVEA